jgi:hypothetical protein
MQGDDSPQSHNAVHQVCQRDGSQKLGNPSCSSIAPPKIARVALVLPMDFTAKQQ